MNKPFLIGFSSQVLTIFSVITIVFTSGIMVFNEQKSLSSFSLIIFFGYLPELLLISIVGSVVDRFSKKKIIIFCNVLLALIFGLYALTVYLDKLDITFACVFVALSSSVSGVHRLCYNASIAFFSKNTDSYPRLNGIVQSGLAISHTAAPLVSGFLIQYTNFSLVLALTSTLCIVSACIFVFVSYPTDVVNKASPSVNNGGFIFGIRVIRSKPLLVNLLLIHSIYNFARGGAIVLFTPLILSISSESVLGMLRSVAGIGMGVGCVLINLWFSRSKINLTLLFFLNISGVCIALIGFTQNVLAIGICVFVLFITTPILATFAHSIWQKVVPQQMHGRVFSVRDSIAGLSVVGGYILFPYLAEFTFRHSSLSQPASINSVYVLFGLITVLAGILSWSKKIEYRL
ncbi:MAG: MFS transporter [Gammaproteobacteria bacterium]|nr:MAG: MFS transporter [Gammaproteobacteria bacterium]